MKIELDNYGFMLETEWCYVALSWELLIATTLLLVGYKAYKIYLKRNGLVGWNY
jgi:uncharacterized PurR-regulated membrane protein YhhQ (DUF165 family)